MTDRSDLLLRLGGARNSLGQESTSSGADLGKERQERSLDALSDLVGQASGEAHEMNEPDPTKGLVDAARAGFEALRDRDAPLTPHMQLALEAIVLADGSRPALLVQDDHVDPADKALGEWQADILGGLPSVQRIAQSVGRVSLPGADTRKIPIGTVFAVGPALVATNRHVLQAIATGDAGGWRFRPGCLIDFCAEHDRSDKPERQFAPDEVRFVGPDAIAEVADLSLLDLAVISLKPNGLKPPPEALPLAEDPNQLSLQMPIGAFGFPAAPVQGTIADRVLFKLFRGVFGVKRLAPGRVTGGLGDIAGDAMPPRDFSHDASTLGGNSGSCIVAMDGTWDVVGLHFGGRQQIANYGHAMAAIRQFLP